MKPILLSFPGNEQLSQQIADNLKLEIGEFDLHTFPDGETKIQVLFEPQFRDIIIVNSLNNPNEKIIPLIFLVQTLKEFGAKSIGLVAPYLPYMRQDKSFNEFESISAKYFAEIISNYFDWLITADPHLHRYYNLSEIYNILNYCVHAAPNIAQWITKNIEKPIIVGPDSESKQWVKAVAELANCPYTVLEKVRKSDTEVEIIVKDLDKWFDLTPVIVDDIISTGQTIIKVVEHLRKNDFVEPVCIAVHGVFAKNSYVELLRDNIKVVTSNTILHKSNAIDLSDAFSESIRKFI